MNNNQPHYVTRAVPIVSDEATNTFEGLACKYNIKDSYGTTFYPGCFTTGGLDTNTYALLWMHSPDQPIGILRAEERKDGLYIVGEWDQSHAGQNARATALSGSASELSVGFEWLDWSMENQTEIHNATLREVSQVTTRFGAVPGSAFTAARAILSASETRAGRVLSAANEEALQKAVELLCGVLGQIDAMPVSNEPDGDEGSADTNNDGDGTRFNEEEMIAANKRSRETLSLITRLAVTE